MTVFETLFKTDGVPTLNDVHGTSVSVTRGALSSKCFKARRKAVRSYAYASMGIDAKFTVREYYLPKAGYKLGTTVVNPQPGDQITDGTETWELFTPDGATKAAEILRAEEWHCYARKISG